MNKRDFLKTAGLFGAASIIPSGGNILKAATHSSEGECVLIPSETAGPFPLDLTENVFYFRTDVREGLAGVQLNLKMKIIGKDDCAAMQNVRVNIWHCDKDGNYSGYGTEVGETYMRGYQITDVNGEANFITILPGWYTGRVCHIHFQVYVNSSYAAISQLTFDPVVKNAIYGENADIYTKGLDPLAISSDGVFADGYEYQYSDLTESATAEGYDAYLEVTVKGTGTVGYLELQNAKQFSLGQNFPNPCMGETVIPFSLLKSSSVSITLWDLTGKKAATLLNAELNAGEHTVIVDLDELGLARSNYIYQLQIENADGVFNDCKMITLAK